MDGDRCYTLEEATALLPEIRRLVAVLQGEHAKGANGSRPPSPEEVLARLEELQVPLRDIRLGLVDFPHERDGRRVWLCWMTDEDVIGFWHETDEGASRRKPL
ncbi:MAG: DUF2203 domain-containing protein [Acidimicrobiia bacterium]|nr:DUF2203 domain-containing protein [Acidimicrobiia bacterium]